jgi:hypothetical protein
MITFILDLNREPATIINGFLIPNHEPSESAKNFHLLLESQGAPMQT